MRRGLHHQPTILREQTALNYVIHHESAPVGLLPDWCNWICIGVPPKLDEANQMLVEPEPPYRPIGVLHLVSPAKSHEFSLATRQGATIVCYLHYFYWRERQTKRARAMV